MSGPVELVPCERRNMRLTATACAKLWLSAQENRPAPWEGRAACRACPVGAARAGKPDEAKPDALAALDRLCPRCLRPAPRLVNDWLCISCANRSYEAMRGRNGRGGRPRLCDVLHTESATVIDAHGAREVRRENVTGLVELAIMAARTATGGLVLTAPPLKLPPT